MALPHVNAGQPAKAAEQNDLIDTVNGHTASLSNNGSVLDEHASRLSTLEYAPSGGGGDAGRYFGQWGDPNNSTEGTMINTGSAGTKIGDFTRDLASPQGCRLVGGSVILDVTGKWHLAAQAQYTGQNNAVRAIYFALSDAAAFPVGYVKYGLLAGPTMDAQSTSAVLNVTAGQAVSLYVAHWGGNGGAFRVWRANTNLFTASYIGA